jgi:hypothetical protein
MAAAKRILASGLALAGMLSVAPAFALDFTVSRKDDPAPDGCPPGDCSLREAVIAANAAPGADRVLLPASTQPYALTRSGADEDLGATGDLDIVGELEISGTAAAQAVIVQARPDRLLHVQPGGRLVLVNLTLQGGRQVMQGGAIYVPAGSLALSGSVLQQNSALDRGGALYVRSQGSQFATLEVSDTRFVDNSAVAGGAILLAGQVGTPTLAGLDDLDFVTNRAVQRGGAVAIEGDLATGSKIEVRRSGFVQNQVSGAEGAGGALSNASPATANVTVRDSEFLSNQAPGEAARGGALLEVQRIERSNFNGNRAAQGGAVESANATVVDSEFCDNEALRNGGALAARDASVLRSTFCRNQVTGDAPGDGGGAIYLYSLASTLGVARSTFDANFAAVGGAILQFDGTLALLQSTLVEPDPLPAPSLGSLLRYAGPLDNDVVQLTANILHGGCSFAAGTAVVDLATHNLAAPGDSCGLTAAAGPNHENNLVFDSVDDLPLAPLGDNGGPTRTRVPSSEAAHPAVDHVPTAGCVYPLDQRGWQRTDLVCDAGALELSAAPPPDPRIFASGFEG